MEEVNMNWLAYFSAVIAQMLIGYIWFHPKVMGTYWAKANGLDFESLRPTHLHRAMLFTLLYTLLFTFFLKINVTGPGQDIAPDGHSYITFQHGLVHACILTLMVIVPVFGTPAQYEKRNWNWAICHVGYWFLRMAVACGILSMWR